MPEGFVSDGRGFLVSAVASGAFDPEGASNLVWSHMAASAVSLAKGMFLIIPISCSIGQPILVGTDDGDGWFPFRTNQSVIYFFFGFTLLLMRFVGLITERLGEHKNRVLSATDHWQVVEAGSRNRASGKSGTAGVREDHHLPNSEEEGDLVVVESGSARFGQEDVIKEVVGSQRRADGSGEPGDSMEVDEQKAKEVGIELPHATDVLHKNGSDGLEMNDVSGLRTVGILNTSSAKVFFFL